MTEPSLIAERSLRTFEAMDRLKRRGRMIVVAAILIGGALGLWQGGMLYGIAGGGIAAVALWVPVRLVRRSLERRLTELSALDAATVAKVGDRYRIARSVERASRWKLFR